MTGSKTEPSEASYLLRLVGKVAGEAIACAYVGALLLGSLALNAVVQILPGPEDQ